MNSQYGDNRNAMTTRYGDNRDATEIICYAFAGDPDRVAEELRNYRTGSRVMLPYGSVARTGENACTYWPGSALIALISQARTALIEAQGKTDRWGGAWYTLGRAIAEANTAMDQALITAITEASAAMDMP